MGSIGPSEVLIVLLVALIVLGPNRLPDAARQVGRALAELRRLSAGFQEELRGAFEETTRSPAPPRADDPEAPSALDGDPPLPGASAPPAGGYSAAADAADAPPAPDDGERAPGR